MLEHGRGIIMTRNVFDSVVFNEIGNQVILTKRIPR
jgi:anti-sigma regulatory factor (Ser/Thr protein kinase)